MLGQKKVNVLILRIKLTTKQEQTNQFVHVLHPMEM